MRELFAEWRTRVYASYDPLVGLRLGQHLYNNLPPRFFGNVPHAVDPFYRDTNNEVFLVWVESHWEQFS